MDDLLALLINEDIFPLNLWIITFAIYRKIRAL